MLPEVLPPGWDESDAESFARRFGWCDSLDLDLEFQFVCSALENCGWLWVGGISDGANVLLGELVMPAVSVIMSHQDFPFFFWAWQQVASDCKLACVHPVVRFLHPSPLSSDWIEVRLSCRPIQHEVGGDSYFLLRSLLPYLDRGRIELESTLSALLG